MDSIQSKLGYDFTYDEYLLSAFFAAHRSDEDGIATDGNRGMARIGQIAVEMAETYHAVVVEKARLTDINRRRYWWKDKKKVATACKMLEIEPNIVRSARQNGQDLSVEVLNFALNAVIGAVWLDCQAQNRSVNDTCNTISRILSQIDAILNTPTAVGGDQDRSLIAKSSAQVFSTGIVTHEIPDVNTGSDLETTEALGNIEICESPFEFPPLSFLEELGDLVDQPSSPQRSFLEQQPFPEYNTAESFDHHHDQRDRRGSLSAGNQDVGAQVVFPIVETVMEHTTPNRAADGSISATATTKRGLSGRESGNPGGAQHAGYWRRKSKRAQTERDKVNAALEPLLDAERQKIGAYPQPERTKLLRYLEYPQTTLLKDSYHLFRFLYLAVGSWGTLADFASQLQSVREARRPIAIPSPLSSTALVAFNMMCQLDNERTTCVLLKRYYAIQFLEDGQRYSQPCQSMHVETPETFGSGNASQIGNPQVRQDAAEIKFLTSKIVHDVENAAEKYPTVYSKVKRFRQLGKRLQILTKRFGIGVLVLLPSGPSFPGFSLTDHVLSDININDLADFAALLEEKQGPLLRKLSNAITPALLALVAFYQGHNMDHLPNLIDVEGLRDIPKALLTLPPDVSHGI